MRVLQISDLHIAPNDGEKVYGVDSFVSLELILQKAMLHAPDLVVATGDLTERGDAASYERLAALLSPLSVPILVLPGNHDSPAVMASTLYCDQICGDRVHDIEGCGSSCSTPKFQSTGTAPFAT